MRRPRLYATNAAKQAAYRKRLAILRARAVKLWVLPASQAPRLSREVPWLRSLVQERDALRRRRDDLEALAEIGRRWESEKQRILAAKDELADKVAKIESKKHEREQRAKRRRQQRQQDPEREARRRAALPFGDRLSSKPPSSAQTVSAQPAVPVTRQSAFQQPPAPLARPAAPAPREEPWWSSVVTAPSVPRPTPPPNADSAKLLERIRKAGYQTRDGKVLYNGTELLTPEEWIRRMPGILD